MSTTTPRAGAGGGDHRPRRIRFDSTGWVLLCEAATILGLPGDQLPGAALPTDDRDAVRQVLIAREVMSPDGRPNPAVRGALALLTTAPVALTVETARADRAVLAHWRTLGVPTAGVTVSEHRDREGTHREIELAMLTSDDLVAEVLRTLLGDGAASADTPDTAERQEAFELATDDLVGAPAGVIDDQGDLAARAVVRLEGPAGTTLAQLLGDGQRWWQVGAVAPDRLRWDPVDRGSLRSVLIEGLAVQLATATAGEDG